MVSKTQDFKVASEPNTEGFSNTLLDFYMCDSITYNHSKAILGVCQMDNGMVTDFEATVAIEQDAFTTFIEQATTVEGTSTRNTLDVSTYIETNADIKSYLARPNILTSGQWTTSQGNNTALATGDIKSYLTSVSMWQQKVKGFNLIKGDFLLKVQLNASPFQQGKLLLHYLPNYQNFVTVNPKYTQFKNIELVQKVQHPHLELDCRTTSVTMRIPYVAPTGWFAVKEQYYDWGTWFLDVFSTLKTGATAPVGQQYADYTVYGWWENIELAAPTVPQSDSSTVVRRGGKVEETKENQGPISLGLKKAAKIANVLTQVPVLSSFAGSVEWVTNIMAGVTSVLGWSKPRELTGQTNVFPQILRYAGTCDGPDTALPGGMSCLNRLEVIDYASFTNEDEMSLAYLYQVPYYANEITWDATDGQGTSLYSQKIGPTSFLTARSDIVNGHTTTFEYHVPFTQMARFHELWRGGIDVTLKIVKTQMHSGRLQVSYVPCSNVAVTPTTGTAAYNKRAIIDIRTEDTVTFNLPYMLLTDFAPTHTGVQNAYMGQLDIQVLNDLRGPESVSQDVRIQIFYSAGSDYEVAVPSQAYASPVPYEAQSDGRTLVRDSVKQGTEMASMEIGGKNTRDDSMFHVTRCTGEKMLSIKSYLLRMSNIQAPIGSGFTFNTGANGYIIDPYFISVQKMNALGVLEAPDFCGDAYSLFASWFSYSRGGMRIFFKDFDPLSKLYSIVTPYPHTALTTAPYLAAISGNGVIGPNCVLTGNSNTFPFEPVNWNTDTEIYQHIPYYNKFPFSLNSYYNKTDNNGTNFSKPNSFIEIRNSGTEFSNTCLFQRAVADDFQLTFFTGCPPLVTSYV